MAPDPADRPSIQQIQSDWEAFRASLVSAAQNQDAPAPPSENKLNVTLPTAEQATNVVKLELPPKPARMYVQKIILAVNVF